MPTIFTKIINGELPGRFVWKDEEAVAFLSIHPLAPGHTLVVPRLEVDHWLDAPAALRAHLFEVSHCIGKALEHAFQPEKVGLMIAGLEVPHLHIHMAPIREVHDLDFARVDMNAKPEDLDAAAAKLRGSLTALGFTHVAD